MMKTRYIFAAFLAMIFGTAAFAQTSQSKGFTVGKWVEVQNGILRELNRSYVDSLPLDRIERKGIDAMLENLDPYTIYIPEEETEDLQMLIGKTYGGIGAVIYKPDVDGNVIINEPYANSPAAKNGLKCGDEITAIDGVSVHGLTSSESSEKMKGKPGTTVVFTVKKLRGETVDIPVVRERIHLPDIEYAGMLDQTNGYIYQSGFTEGVSTQLKDAFLKLKAQGMQKLFLDLRGNGGGLMQEAINIVSLFVPKGSLVLVSKGKDASSEQKYYTTLDPIDLEMPIVVLVDGGSASSSEIVTGGLQDLDRATVMGKRTYGKGLVQSIRPLPYNGQLKITTAKYYTPSGRCVQAIDYAKRGDDGSVAHIPDSLTHEFKTAHGRTVRDGGGITPDQDIPVTEYSRLTYAVVAYGLPEQWALEYVRAHESIPDVKDFKLTDEDYKTFVEWAKTKDFDYRSEAKTYFDLMKKELDKEKFSEGMKAQLEAMEKALEMDKETYLNQKKNEIIPFIEEEIAVRYYFQEAGIQVRLKYDDQLKEALKRPLIEIN